MILQIFQLCDAITDGSLSVHSAGAMLTRAIPTSSSLKCLTFHRRCMHVGFLRLLPSLCCCLQLPHCKKGSCVLWLYCHDVSNVSHCTADVICCPSLGCLQHTRTLGLLPKESKGEQVQRIHNKAQHSASSRRKLAVPASERCGDQLTGDIWKCCGAAQAFKRCAKHQ